MSAEKQSTVSNPMCFGLLAGGLAGYLAYRADLDNVAVAAAALDWLTGHVYLWCPALPKGLWFAVSGLCVGGLAFFVVALLSACLAGPDTGSAGMEAQLKRRVRRQKRAHQAGFNS